MAIKGAPVDPCLLNENDNFSRDLVIVIIISISQSKYNFLIYNYKHNVIINRKIYLLCYIIYFFAVRYV